VLVAQQDLLIAPSRHRHPHLGPAGHPHARAVLRRKETRARRPARGRKGGHKKRHDTQLRLQRSSLSLRTLDKHSAKIRHSYKQTNKGNAPASAESSANAHTARNMAVKVTLCLSADGKKGVMRFSNPALKGPSLITYLGAVTLSYVRTFQPAPPPPAARHLPLRQRCQLHLRSALPSSAAQNGAAV
jgi:hypothetical protein